MNTMQLQLIVFWSILIQNLAIVSSLMILAWLVYLVQRRGTLLDVAWAGSFFVVAIISTFTPYEGVLLRKILFLAIVSMWSLRLTAFLFLRYYNDEEGGRWAALASRFKIDSSFKFVLLFVGQGIATVILSWPFVLIFLNPDPDIQRIEWIGFALWIFAFLGETYADKQLREFKSLPQNKDKVCQEGLWRYSRHPNYFFEWLIWLSYFLIALAAPFGITAIISPLLMWHIIFHVPGIKALEDQAIIRKGEAYKEYQRTTNAFFPWFPIT